MDPGSSNIAALTTEEVHAIESYRKQRHTAVLAIMFTDIVGSTGAAEQLGDQAYARLRHLHDELFQRIVTRNDAGTIIKQIGDSFLCVFAEPSSAVERAIEFQRALRQNREHLTAEGYTLKVRIGIHLGQVAVEDALQQDVFGRHVNMAARVESLAEAGQVLTTRSVWENAVGWVATNGAAGVSHVRYGKAKVKGFEEPIEIYGFYAKELGAPAKPKAILRRRRKTLVLVVMAALAVAGAFGAMWQFRPKVAPVVAAEHGTYYVQLDFSALAADSVGDKPELDTVWLKETIMEQAISVLAPAKVIDEHEARKRVTGKGAVYGRRDHTTTANALFYQDTMGITGALFIKALPALLSLVDSFNVGLTLTMFDDGGFNSFGGREDIALKDLDARVRAQVVGMIWNRDQGVTLGTVVNVGQQTLEFKLDPGRSVSKGAKVELQRWFKGGQGAVLQMEWIRAKLRYSRTLDTVGGHMEKLIADSIACRKRIIKPCEGCSYGCELEISGKVVAILDSVATVSWKRVGQFPENPAVGDEVKLED